MSVKRVFLQLLKFGVSGILGVTISAILFYGFRGQLPVVMWLVGFWFWIYPLDVFDIGFYVLTTIIGGTVHFLLSKIWVFERK